MRRVLIALILLFCAGHLVAKTQDVYPFKTSQQRQQFERLTNSFRCLVCQNENLAASDAPLANDLRKQIYTLIMADQSDEAIKTFLTNRYSNFVLYQPPVKSNTLLLWLLPFILLVIGFLYLIRYTRHRKEKREMREEKELEDRL